MTKTVEIEEEMFDFEAVTEQDVIAFLSMVHRNGMNT